MTSVFQYSFLSFIISKLSRCGKLLFLQIADLLWKRCRNMPYTCNSKKHFAFVFPVLRPLSRSITVYNPLLSSIGKPIPPINSSRMRLKMLFSSKKINKNGNPTPNPHCLRWRRPRISQESSIMIEKFSHWKSLHTERFSSFSIEKAKN